MSKGFLAREGILNLFNSVQMVNMFVCWICSEYDLYNTGIVINVVKNFKLFFVSILCLCSITDIFSHCLNSCEFL